MSSKDKILDHYKHSKDLRANNPDIGLVKGGNDPQVEKQTYKYDPHIDPSLQWAGKEERPSLKVDTRSIYKHERVAPQSIIEKLRKDSGQDSLDLNFFEGNRLSFTDAIAFYKHEERWSNRFIAGDSALVMNSLLQKESMAGKVQCIYMDPPYGIKYSSNFQPFVDDNSADYSEKTPSTEPEMIKAFRDTWELGIHSYLSYLRDRTLLCRELLNEKGSMFVQIGDENVHHVREIMDEIFGADNYVSLIAYKSTSGTTKAKGIRRIHNYIIWYAKDKEKFKFNRLFEKTELENVDVRNFSRVENINDGERRSLTAAEKKNPKIIDKKWRLYTNRSIISSGAGNNEKREFNGKLFSPPLGNHWRHSTEAFERLKKQGRFIETGKNIRYISYFDEFPYTEYTSNWNDSGPELNKFYVVQTSPKIVQNCMLMTSDPGDLIFDPTCGGGTTAYVAEEWGRRWITCDTSRISITLAKQRLLTSVFPYYRLADEQKGINEGFIYDEHKRPQPSKLANEESLEVVKLYDKPHKDTRKQRVTGPFTIDGLPSNQAPEALSLQDQNKENSSLDNDKTNITLREWCAELRQSGIRGKSNNKIEFNEVRLISDLMDIQAEGETREASPKKVMISFGPMHSALGASQVEKAWQEASIHKPDILLFVALQFDAEADKTIANISEKRVGMQMLRVQMNSDYSVSDLKKQAKDGDSFWLLGEPDVQINKITTGDNAGKIEVVVNGYDYYDPIQHKIISSGKDDTVACWLLDEDYDGRCLIPRQVFLPMARDRQDWRHLAKNLRITIDQDNLNKYTGNKSIPFTVQKNKTVAVKIIDKRGVESLKVLKL